MNKTELLEKLDKLIAEAKIDEANAENHKDRVFFIGRQNGLLWARLFILELEEK